MEMFLSKNLFIFKSVELRLEKMKMTTKIIRRNNHMQRNWKILLVQPLKMEEIWFICENTSV